MNGYGSYMCMSQIVWNLKKFWVIQFCCAECKWAENILNSYGS